MASSSPLELEALGLRLAAETWGEPHGAPVLALHGWLDNAATFSRLAPLLSGVHLVAVDLPGHGRSQHKPPSAFYHFVDWVGDVLAIADALGWQRFSILGHSMGAGIASLVPAAAPGRIERLVLLEGLGPLAGALEETAARLRQAVLDRQRLARKELKPYASLDTAVRMLKKAIGDIGDRGAELLAARGTMAVPGGVLWRTDPRLRGASPLRCTEAQARALLAAIDCPALLVRAEQGHPFLAGIEERIAVVPGLRVLTVPGGHHVHLDHPERVAGAVSDFLLGR